VVATKRFDAGREFLDSARDSLKKKYLPKAVACLNALSEQDIWWRPNEASNSAGNLALHLCGNVRQWIISGIGGATDVRHRDHEFSERGPLPRKGLIALLRATVNEACRVLARTPSDSLGDRFSRQGFEMTRLRAITHVVEHFYCHTGQMLYITKLRNGRDPQLTHLPQPKAAKRSRKKPGPERSRLRK
jgi:uncharacterized damage-inducible protein DinB